MKKSAQKKSAKRVQPARPGSSLTAPNKGMQTVSAPTALGTITFGSSPSYTSGPDGAIRIRRRELVKTVNLPTNQCMTLTDDSIAVPGFDLTPSSAIMFPWLSRIASRFERYQFHALRVDLVSSSPTTVGGRVYMAIDYDYNDAPATTAQQLMSNRTSAEGPVWAGLTLTADPKELHPDMPFKYCNAITKGNFVEPRTAYAGYLMIGSAGLFCSAVVDLWITYDVTLRVPVFESSELGQCTGSVETGNFPELLGTTAAYHSPSLSVPANALVAQVVPGSAGVPPISHDGVSLPRVLDISRAASAGLNNLVIQTSCSKIGVTPSALMASMNGLRPSWQLFDSAGSHIGGGSYTPDYGYSTAGDPGDALDNNWSLAGGSFRVSSTLSLANMVKTFPSARYLAALWKGAAAIAGVTRSSGMKWEL